MKVNKSVTCSDEDDDSGIINEDEEPGWMSWHCLMTDCWCLSLTNKHIHTHLHLHEAP